MPYSDAKVSCLLAIRKHVASFLPLEGSLGHGDVASHLLTVSRELLKKFSTAEIDALYLDKFKKCFKNMFAFPPSPKTSFEPKPRSSTETITNQKSNLILHFYPTGVFFDFDAVQKLRDPVSIKIK